MGQYTVIEPCSFIEGKKAVQHVRKSDVPVKIDDDAAAPLVAEGKLAVFPPAPPAQSEGDAVTGESAGTPDGSEANTDGQTADAPARERTKRTTRAE